MNTAKVEAAWSELPEERRKELQRLRVDVPFLIHEVRRLEVELKQHMDLVRAADSKMDRMRATLDRSEQECSTLREKALQLDEQLQLAEASVEPVAVPVNSGWRCPVCSHILSPYVKYCTVCVPGTS